MPRPLGPTPRYGAIPRWGLRDVPPLAEVPETVAHPGPSPRAVSIVVTGALGVFAAAAVLHALRYALLMVNRTVLLPSWLALAGTWVPLVVGVLALFAVVAVALTLTAWLIARRGAAYAADATVDPRGRWSVRWRCLVPLVNLLTAPVLVWELAAVRGHLHRLRRLIVGWWLAWLLTCALATWSTLTSRPSDVQGVADTTEVAVLAFAMAAVTLLLMRRLVAAFDRAPAEQVAHRWVAVAPDGPDDPEETRGPGDARDARATGVPVGTSTDPVAAVEEGRTEPAA